MCASGKGTVALDLEGDKRQHFTYYNFTTTRVDIERKRFKIAPWTKVEALELPVPGTS